MDDNNALPTVEDFEAAFGIKPVAEEGSTNEDSNSDAGQSGTASEENTDTNQGNADGTDSNESESGTDASNGSEDNSEGSENAESPEATQKALNATQKQNQAFAKMRSENKVLGNTVIRMAETLGLDTTQPLNVLVNQINSMQVNALAQRRGLDPQVMQRLEALEASQAELNQLKATQRAKEQLDEIVDRFGADQATLEGFVQDLYNEGYDISKPGANLVNEFIGRNFDKIVNAKVADAVAQEQARSSKASGASSPSGQRGQKDEQEQHVINTVAELDEFFAKNS